ncbi:hypothetical protein GYA54_01760 [Candidatus Kuenenbacteria bacterium]|nr:hypothetical protein [Candidatus Kuenenbacteria bacterium]
MLGAENNIEKTNQNQNKDLVIKGDKGKRGLWTMIIVLAVVAGLAAFNIFQDKISKEEKKDAFPVTLEQLKDDFENSNKKLKSEVVPPAEYVRRFDEPLKLSLSAVESGVPSQPGYVDLSEDYLNIASVYSILGDYERAEEWYYKTLEKYPENYKAHLNLADLYILMEQRESAAIKFYETAILYPQDSRVYIKMADFYYKYSSAPDRIIKAAAIYEQGIKKAEDPKIIFSEYAFFLENYMKNYKKALEMQQNYQLTSGEIDQEEIGRLKALIDKNK